MALLFQTSPFKHEREVPLVQQVRTDCLALKLTGSVQVVADIVRALMPQHAYVDQRASVNVDWAATEEAQFVKTDKGQDLDVAPRKFVKNNIDVHCDRDENSAGTAEEEWQEVRHVHQVD